MNEPLHVDWLGRQPYEAALAHQEELLERAVREPQSPDHLLLLEHDHVYTLGRGADEHDLQDAPQRLGVPSYRVGRGGGVTYHGPGQLVGYPIVRLPGGDVQRYVHLLEEALILTCAQFDVSATRHGDAIGVWASRGKIGSIGIGVRRGVAYHGIALNVAPDLEYFEQVIACREAALRFTTLAQAAAVQPALARVAQVFRDCFAQIFGYRDVRSMGW